MERNVFAPQQMAWIEALESGKYRQTCTVLTRAQCEGGAEVHCCLGVASVLYMDAGLPLKRIYDGRGHYDYYTPSSTIKHTSSLPRPVREWLGLKDHEGSVIRVDRLLKKDSPRSLANANDSGWTFAEIAADLRARPWLYFTNFDAPEQSEHYA